MRLHNTQRTIRVRLVTIFIVTFVLAFLALNSRFVEANIQYVLFPKTIRTADSIRDAVALLPLAQAVENKPLPNRARLVIDSIGVDAPIVFNISSDNDAIYKNLENGVVHYSNTVRPGEGGTAVILGHSSAYPWYKGDFGAVFALLGRLKPGDRFYVQYEDGRSFFYQMKEALIFNPFSDSKELDALEQRAGDAVILLSCYPVGTNYKRIAVLAERIEL